MLLRAVARICTYCAEATTAQPHWLRRVLNNQIKRRILKDIGVSLGGPRHMNATSFVERYPARKSVALAVSVIAFEIGTKPSDASASALAEAL